MIQPPTSETLEKPQPRPFLDLLFSVVIPALILANFSGDDGFGARNALLLALAFPLAWGSLELLKYKSFNLIALLGLIGVLLTGGIALLQLDTVWLAVREAAFPGVLGTAIMVSTRFPRYSVISKMFYMSEVFASKQAKEALTEGAIKEAAEARLSHATYLLAGIFFFAAAMNYLLARWIVVSPTGSAAFNEELARLSLLGYGAIAIPSFVMMIVLFLWLRRTLHHLAGISGGVADEGSPFPKISFSTEIRPVPIRSLLAGSALMLPVAVAIGVWFENPWWQAVRAPVSMRDWGVTIAAAAVGAAIGWLFGRPRKPHAQRMFDWALKPLAVIEPSHRNIALLSLCAGVFEELLFRAALLPVIGLVPAALLFALMHSQAALFAPSRTQATAYFAIIFAIGLLLGWVFNVFGLWAAIVLHGVYDYVLLRLLAPRIAAERARLLASFEQGPVSS